jgi:hypothetical protein
MLEWLDATALSTWLKESPSVWSNPTVLTLHTMGLSVLVGACGVLDLRLLGVSRSIPLSAFRWVFGAVAIGLTVNLVTGVLLFIKNPVVWAASVPFLVKMLLVIASAATVVPIRRYVLSDATQSDVTGLPAEAQRAKAGNIRLIAIVSIVAWSAAVTAGRLLAYLQP